MRNNIKGDIQSTKNSHQRRKKSLQVPRKEGEQEWVLRTKREEKLLQRRRENRVKIDNLHQRGKL